MSESTKNAGYLESLVARVDALVSSISDREKILSAIKADVDAFQAKMEKSLEDKTQALEDKISQTLSTDLKSTVDYTKELYTRFERMVWLGLVLLAAVSAFIGYQTFSSIPEKITSEISKLATNHTREVETLFTNQKNIIESSSRQMKSEEERLAAKRKDFEQQLAVHETTAARLARERGEQLAVNYGNKFREFQIDVWVQTLQRRSIEVQSAEAEIIRQLIQEFPIRLRTGEE